MKQQEKFIHICKQGQPYFILIKKISAKYLKNFFCNQSYQQAVAALNIIFYLLFKI